MKNLKVIEWNVASVSVDNEKRVNDIVTKICEQEADVVVLTEVTFAYRDIAEKLLNSENSNFFVVGTSNAGNANNILIAVTNVKIDKVIFNDFYAYQTGNNKKAELKYEQNNHPDRLLAHLKLKNGKEMTLMGVRMQVSGLSNYDKRRQFEAFKWEIEDSRPDIIIGDFNWNSAIQIINKENEFNDVLLTRCRKVKRGRRSFWKNIYNMWPDGTGDVISFISKDGTKAGNPDRVMWKENITVSKHEYLNKLTVGASFPDSWPSDHDILILEVEI